METVIIFHPRRKKWSDVRCSLFRERALSVRIIATFRSPSIEA